jgi:hypothetical protein
MDSWSTTKMPPAATSTWTASRCESSIEAFSGGPRSSKFGLHRGHGELRAFRVRCRRIGKQLSNQPQSKENQNV